MLENNDSELTRRSLLRLATVGAGAAVGGLFAFSGAVPAVATVGATRAGVAESSIEFQDVPGMRAEYGATPTTTVSELPEWARASSPWLVYPDGLECTGTEGRPNDFRALVGEPSNPLPAGVEYYDPERHDGRIVFPSARART